MSVYTNPHVKENDVVGQLAPGMERVFFPPETLRHVHVNRHAIVENTKRHRSHPTCVVTDECGNKHEFHAVVIRGSTILQFSDLPKVDASTYLATYSGIDGYINPKADGPYVPVYRRSLGSVFQAGLNGLAAVALFPFRLLYSGAQRVPVLSCLLPERD